MTQLHSNCFTSLSKLPTNDYAEIALILGDQLNASHSWYHQKSKRRLFVMFEMRQETDYCRHHIQKVVGFFAAMRNFASALAKAGHNVLYLTLDHSDNKQSLTDNLAAVAKHCNSKEILLQQPDEYRLDKQFDEWQAPDSCSLTWHDSEHFLTERNVLNQWFGDKDNYLMEHFYRRVRKQTGYLMEDGKPVGGKWNYDKENRKSLKASAELPEPLLFAHDVSALVELLEQEGVDTFGHIDPNNFIWPVQRSEAKQLLSYFTEHLLSRFGDYQDAMLEGHWALYHARISFALNTKMLSPKQVVEAALSAWQANPDDISLNQIEGFIRQIIGWREFVRAIYWHFMPAYADSNFLEHERPLPDFYWTGKTQMNCLQHSITQSLDYAYAHHIQRLMVTGNFALLAGCAPDAVDAWYLGVYIDAIEWVELPNTRAMSQFADGGKLATKPYVSSGSYINKMSNYCKSCHYDVQTKVGDGACPFNLLYWHFIDRHQQRFANNSRMALILSQWRKRDESEKKEIREQAESFLANLGNSPQQD
ncbi:cryptochrome/photolyase family protein [Pseudidiomarina terrestris]|uniref:Cryptochrome/photolyase family protein n=1 Tax=Pseudidiomarina terrestris TaxID=2820060 RepID=A0ABT8MK05_9GAMM|nr:MULTISPECIES: cryptochrome/photolyase family protein [unclassified Pseudidiomarina]MDN7127539.1 cryptochrome/photolyase family protein [Pseudidiomarina sp. 1APR75-33.1]MDN7130285.1 cryptochrome/photolyase family protein [Pseudidiomarina sp. 1APR75-15]MDN7136208.1 cryptochrome/photolyase family protein [Pseudidiomarina sp. 1ASP75-5]MEA3588662.1 cryptochrome/photolyase family protein [Pseudidiomarina sp. 1APP75-27a]